MKEKVAAKTRYEDLLIKQGERTQQAEIEGEIYQFQMAENRSNADIELYQGLYSGFAAQQNNARIAKGKASATMIGGVATAVGGAVQAGQAHKAMRSARDAKNDAYAKMNQAIADRREITNPYAGVTDLSGLASDLSSQITNPFNNLQVSTAAAEM